jgi:predicted nucleic acid-binding protein
VVFTELTRLECRTKPLATGDALLLKGYDDFLATPGYFSQPMDTAVFDLATDLRTRHRLKTPDALHLAAAIIAGCDEFWTNDARLSTAAAPYLRLLTIDSL